MPVTNILLVFSVMSGLMSILLFVFTIFLEKDKKKSKIFLLWAVLFLISAFAAAEYAFWLEGYNLFDFIFNFNFPLTVYFGVWLAFVIWLFETRKERKLLVILLGLLVIGIIVAVNCMNCIRF